MLYRVETQTTGDRFAAAMSEMRTWLDRHRLEPDSFRELRAGSVTAFVVGFKSDAQAAAFAAAFSGRLLGAGNVAALGNQPSVSTMQSIG